MLYIITAIITSLWSILLQQLLRLYNPYRYSNYPVLINYTATAPITSLWPILLQQLSCPYNLYRYSHYHVLMIHTITTYHVSMNYTVTPVITMIYMITANITSLRLVLLPQLLRLHDLYCYSTYHTFMNYIITATITFLWSTWLQQLSRLTIFLSQQLRLMINLVTAYYVLMINIPGERPPRTNSRDWRTPARCAIPGAARRTPRLTSKTMPFVLSYCFFCFAICVIRYLPNWRP